MCTRSCRTSASSTTTSTVASGPATTRRVEPTNRRARSSSVAPDGLCTAPASHASDCAETVAELENGTRVVCLLLELRNDRRHFCQDSLTQLRPRSRSGSVSSRTKSRGSRRRVPRLPAGADVPDAHARRQLVRLGAVRLVAPHGSLGVARLAAAVASRGANARARSQPAGHHDSRTCQGNEDPTQLPVPRPATARFTGPAQA